MQCQPRRSASLSTSESLKQSRHVINLRGPWQWLDGSSTGQVGSPGFQRFQFPDELKMLSGQIDSNCLLLARDFGRPSGLTDRHRVELVINQFAGCRDVRLNDQHLDFEVEQPGLGRCDIGSLVQWRNRLRIDYEIPQVASSRPLPLQEVRIEIIETM